MAIAIVGDQPAKIDQHTFPLQIINYYKDRLARYSESPIYYQLVEYLRGGEATLEHINVPRNRRRYLRKVAKSYRLPEIHEPQYLKFIKSTGAISIYLTEPEIPRYLHTAYKDHSHHAAALTLDFLVGRVY